MDPPKDKTHSNGTAQILKEKPYKSTTTHIKTHMSESTDMKENVLQIYKNRDNRNVQQQMAHTVRLLHKPLKVLET